MQLRKILRENKMTNLPLLTIYTPTYNRKNLLPRLYDSLCNQICKDFIWLVVDDGSSDGTENLINQWKQSAPFQIEYVYKENGGVHTARDLAYSIINTELLVGIDSDDICLYDMVENIVNTWTQFKNKNIIGIITPVYSAHGKWLGTPFPQENFASYQDLSFKYKCVGDHTVVVKSEIMKNIPDAPVFPGEKLVGEGFKWIQLPDSSFYLLKKATVTHYYMEDGYTQNVRQLWFENLKGFAASYNMQSQKAKFFIIRIKNAVKYNIASFFDGNFNCILQSRNIFASFFTYPLAFVSYLYLKIKWNKYTNKKVL
jgi:glycosyltransferase involved in cell wall biosynthesis